MKKLRGAIVADVGSSDELGVTLVGVPPSFPLASAVFIDNDDHFVESFLE
jgi:hypothetical protein